jgi:hypothetical protein
MRGCADVTFQPPTQRHAGPADRRQSALAAIDAALPGYHIDVGTGLTTEVSARHLKGRRRRGGRHGVAARRDRIALWYAPAWIDRGDLANQEKLVDAAYRLAARMPSYITLKDVKKRWGKGQEDIFPVAQFEKLWGDMTSLADLACRCVVRRAGLTSIQKLGHGARARLRDKNVERSTQPDS